ncbi:MAG: acetate--CoA ligase family protein [Armatimonadetes bacterium]|nr:acetate--CoA ligase family protein [Armatimonadota bacterium]
MAMAASMAKVFDALLAPRSVAIVGASADPAKLSAKPLENLLRLGFSGAIYPVNPRAVEIAGLRCYPSVAEMPATPDLAFLVLPARQAVEAAWECARRGVTAAIVAVSGFRESGTGEGEALEEELRRIPHETGMRIVGPNCNGLYNARLGISLGYNAAHAEVIPPGPLTLISHSGALFSTLAGRARELDLGLGVFASVGNEADLGMLDFMEAALDDPDCRVIGLVIEAIRDGPRFRDLVARARRAGKHVVALKLGTSDLGRATTAAHSSRLAGSAGVYSALFAQAGAAEVATPEGLIAAAVLLSQVSTAGGGGLAALTTAGAGGAVLADAAARHGVPFAELSAATRETLGRYSRFAPVLNPVDLGATGPESTEAVACALAADPGVHALVLYATALLRAQSRANVLRGLCAARAVSGKPAVVLSPGGLTSEEEDAYRAAGIRVFHDTGSCFEGLAALLRELPVTGETVPARHGVLTPEVLALLHRDRPLTEPESLRVLQAIGVPVVETRTARDEDGALAAAAAVGWPVVLKGVAPGVAHKSDAGLVLPGVGNEAALRAGVHTLRTRAAAAGARLEEVVVQRQCRGQFEAIAGFTVEPGIGVVLIAGLGGVFAETLEQTVAWVVPATEDQLRRRLRRSVLGRMLESPRLRSPGAFDTVIEILLALQDLSIDPEAGVAALDVNPLMVWEDGVVAVDALVIPRGAVTEGGG